MMGNYNHTTALKARSVPPCNEDGLGVLFLVGTKIYPFNIGGTEIASYYLAKTLSEQGCKVYIITGQTHHRRTQIEIPFRLFRVKTGNIPLIRGLVYFTGSFLKALQLRKRINIIHVQPLFPIGLIGIVLGRIIKKPTVVYARGADLDVYSYRFKSIISWIIKKATFAVALHKKHKKIMQRLSNREHIEMIPNGVDLSENILCDQEFFMKKTNLEKDLLRDIKIVAYCGRLSKVKGIDYLKQAIPAILRSAPNTYFLFIGKGKLETQLRKCAKANHIILTGKIDHKEVSKLLKCSDVFVLPSVREGSSNALLEAMAVGLPIVATNVGGNPDMVSHGITGILVKPYDSIALSNAVLELILNPQLREMYKKNAIKFIEKFSWEKMSKRLLHIYQSALKALHTNL